MNQICYQKIRLGLLWKKIFWDNFSILKKKIVDAPICSLKVQKDSQNLYIPNLRCTVQSSRFSCVWLSSRNIRPCSLQRFSHLCWLLHIFQNRKCHKYQIPYRSSQLPGQQCCTAPPWKMWSVFNQIFFFNRKLLYALSYSYIFSYHR